MSSSFRSSVQQYRTLWNICSANIFQFSKVLVEFLWLDFRSTLRKTISSTILGSWVEHVRRRKKTDIIDFSIYTPNRDFRIVQSAKFEDLCKRHLFIYNPVLKRTCPNRILSVSEYKKSLANVLQSQVTSIKVILFGKARMNITVVISNKFREDYQHLIPSEICNFSLELWSTFNQ